MYNNVSHASDTCVSYCYVCVLILQYMCPHTTICVRMQEAIMTLLRHKRLDVLKEFDQLTICKKAGEIFQVI
jgi:hypothetical protein